MNILTEEYCFKIINDDLLNVNKLNEQNQRLQKEVLVRPLPYNTTLQNGSQELNPMLLETLNDDSETLFGMMKTSLSNLQQDKYVVVSAAPSGSGKTHSAYALGKKCFVTTIRVAVSNNLLIGKYLSPPFNKLDQVLSLIQSELREKYLEKARISLSVIELLFYCYYSLTTEVLYLGVNKLLSLDKLYLLLLKFFRNGTSDGEITRLFELKLQDLKILENIHSIKENVAEVLDVSQLHSELNVYWKSLVERRQVLLSELRQRETIGTTNVTITLDGQAETKENNDHIFVFYLDEVQLLLDKYPKLFLQEESYLKLKGDSNFQLTNESFRPLFYGLSCVCTQFLSANVGIYMTGTNFAISKLFSDGNFNSVERGKIKKFPITYYFTVNDMQNYFLNYFNMQKTFFNSEVKEKLYLFQGRPLFFIHYIFIPFCINIQQMLQREKNGRFSIARRKFLSLINSQLELLQDYIKEDLRNLFSSDARLAMENDHFNVKALYPLLIMDVLCGRGQLKLSEDAIIEAIVHRVIPIAGRHIESNVLVNLIEIEPTTYDMINQHLLCILKKDTVPHYFLYKILSTIQNEKGVVAEAMFCYYLSLSVLRYNGASCPLYDLLIPLYPHESELPFLNKLRNFICKTTKVIDVQRFKTENPDTILKCELELFSILSPQDEEFNDQIILYNLDKFLGIDLAFIVKHEGNPRLVAIQSKNWTTGGLKPSLLTLSPGLQYLTENQREALLELKPLINVEASNDVTGYLSKSWSAYKEWVADNPRL
eukprot:gene14109-15599_t